ncbi:HNH endonuclease [Escherichia albertii]|uniref:HNH endonuclease n=1 Tax=Escherichia albertii TaxID=208962 RepID=UPI001374C9DA|nr:HNH endonuclease [Escherichia albertii]QTA20672.1 HNH endonuclease [Escherichia albertii]
MKPWHEDVRRYFTEHLIYDESSDSLCWSDGEPVTIKTDDYGNKTFNIGRRTFYMKYVVWFLCHGYQSNKKIIHRNGNRADTRPRNLMQVRDFKRN